MNRLIALFLVAVFFACAMAQKTDNIDINSVQLESGKVSAKTSDDNSVKIFMGVPFATPPIGDFKGGKVTQALTPSREIKKTGSK